MFSSLCHRHLSEQSFRQLIKGSSFWYLSSSQLIGYF